MGAVRIRIWILVLLALAGAGVMALLSRMPQELAYHDFADRRTVFGIPNFCDVISNAPFAIAGALGLWTVLRRRRELSAAEHMALVAMFAGVFLTAFGSGYYHLWPDNRTLVWDRLPMTIAFTGLLAAMIAERIGRRASAILLLPMLLLGVLSVVYWHITEQRGAGDLRPYFFVQGFCLLAAPYIAIAFPARYLSTAGLCIALGWYGVAKAMESFDRQVFAATGMLVSGHTLKHIAAAVGVFWIVAMLHLYLKRKRQRPPFSGRAGADASASDAPLDFQ